MNFSEIQLGSLESSIQDLRIHNKLTVFSGSEQWRSLMMEIDGSHSLDDTFSKLISEAFSPLIEIITPAIDEFEDERTNQESVQ